MYLIILVYNKQKAGQSCIYSMYSHVSSQQQAQAHFLSVRKFDFEVIFVYIFVWKLINDQRNAEMFPFAVTSVDYVINQQTVWALINMLPVSKDHFIGSVVEENSRDPFVLCAKCWHLHCSNCSIYNACQTLQRWRIHSEIGSLLERDQNRSARLTKHSFNLENVQG